MILYKTYPAPKEADGKDKNDRDYHNMDSDRWRFLAGKLLDCLPLDFARGHGTLLDVGCGAGYVSNEAKKRGYDVLGIDVSKKATNYASKKFGVKTICSSVFDFKAKQKFDVIVLNHVLEHISDLDNFIQKIKRLMAKDGILLIACPNYQCLMRYIFGERWYGLQPKQHVWQFTPESLTDFLKINGFKKISVVSSSLDYNPTNKFKNLAFRFLTKFAEVLNLGDQIIFLASRSENF